MTTVSAPSLYFNQDIVPTYLILYFFLTQDLSLPLPVLDFLLVIGHF